jgi:phage terminase small subunit
MAKNENPSDNRKARDIRNNRLTPRQETFCVLYANPDPERGMTGRDAYMQAYPTCREIKSAIIRCSELLRQPKIQARVRELRQQVVKRVEHRGEDVLHELLAIGFSKITDYVQWDADGKLTLIPSSELPAEVMGAIKEILTFGTGKVSRIRLHDKVVALDRLGKQYGFFTEKVDITSGGKPISELNDDERLARINALVEVARSRRDQSTGSGEEG